MHDPLTDGQHGETPTLDARRQVVPAGLESLLLAVEDSLQLTVHGEAPDLHSSLPGASAATSGGAAGHACIEHGNHEDRPRLVCRPIDTCSLLVTTGAFPRRADIRTPQRTVRDWRRRGVGPRWTRFQGVGRLHITVAETRRFLASATVTRAEVRSDG